MPLVFQERTDGYRVVRIDGGGEQMLASMQTKQIRHNPPANMSEEAFTQLAADVGMTKALEARDQYAKDRAGGAKLYEPMPRSECTIHSSGGPLTVADIEEMLAHLPE